MQNPTITEGAAATSAITTKNFFDPQENFFLIDSDELDRVGSRLYGFIVQEDGIFENANYTFDGSVPDCRGCFVSVYNDGQGKITIRQDNNGCFGLYLFEHSGYFALSNSFFHLLDHIKSRYPLTLNRDYANHILTLGLSSYASEETPVQEIRLLDRNAVITIDTQKVCLTVSDAGLGEHSLSIDTPEGLAMLDRWYDFWTESFRKLRSATDFMAIDLSGGYDSRLTLLLMLGSGIDLNRINVRSFTDTLHTHAEDYAIASQIAAHYGFTLNNPLPKTEMLNYSFSDAINIETYTKMAFHKEAYYCTYKAVDKLFKINGGGGEAIRSRYTFPAETFIQKNAAVAKKKERHYSKDVQDENYASIERIIRTSFAFAREKYGLPDEDSTDYPQMMYWDGWCRSHFGKNTVLFYFKNTVSLSPLIDPLIRKIRLHTPECPDDNLLMAMIYVRYCPELMDFPYEGNRYSIDPETVAFARQINEKYPRKKTKSTDAAYAKTYSIVRRDEAAAEQIKAGNNPEPVTGEKLNGFLREVFESPEIRGTFMTEFSDQIYDYAERFYSEHEYFPTRHMYSVVGIAQVLRKIEESRHRDRDIYSAFSSFLQEDADNGYGAKVWEKFQKDKEQILTLMEQKTQLRKDKDARINELKAQKTQLRQDKDARINELKAKNTQLRQDKDARINELKAKNTQLRQDKDARIIELKNELTAEKKTKKKETDKNARLQADLDAIINSRSYRFAAFLARTAAPLKKLFKK